MKKESKILIGFIAVLLIALPLMGSVIAVDVDGQESNETYNLLGERVELKGRNQRIVWFFKDAEKDIIAGTITARDRNILIVTDGDGERLNIVMSRRWNMGQDVVSLNQMFEDGYVSIGETVSLDVLKRTFKNGNDVTATIIFCYEISTGSNNLYAVLPFNIN